MTTKQYAFIFGAAPFLLNLSCVPIVGISKFPDEILYDRGMDAMDKQKHDVGCLTFETLIHTSPESGYVAQARATSNGR